MRCLAPGLAIAIALAACTPKAPPAPPLLPLDEPTRTRAVALIEKRECARCHDGLPATPVATEKHCVHCHQEIMAGTFAAPAEALQRWQSHLQSLRDVPSLFVLGATLRREWIQRFLVEPLDVRPQLPATMPRLGLAPDEAEALARLLVPSEAPPRTFAASRVARGRELFTERGCNSCHRFSGTDVVPAKVEGRVPPSLEALAPDLRHTRDRFQSGVLVAWLRDPKRLRPQTLMPNLSLSEDDAEALAAFVWLAPLTPMTEPPPLSRLPVLSRRVAWDEVNQAVFKRTCWHCHSQPDYALGDGGPGNTGGFGFAARGLDLSSATGAASGAIGDDGRRASIFRKQPDGTPRLLAVLLARDAEVRGHPSAGLRGMPLGLPPLSAEQLQLVESWIAQGQPR